MDKAKTIGRWILKVLFAFIVFTAGMGKFSVERWVSDFAAWGYPDNFVYVIGGLEMILPIGLLIPRISGYAAAALLVIFIGATATRIMEGVGVSTLIVHLAYVGIFASWAYTNRPPFLRKAISGKNGGGMAPSDLPDPTS